MQDCREQRLLHRANARHPSAKTIDGCVEVIERNDYLIVCVVADDFLGEFFQLVVHHDYVVAIPTNGTGYVKLYLIIERKHRRNLVRNHFGGMIMPRIKQAADAARCRIVLVELVATDRVAFYTDTEHLAFYCGDNPFLIVAFQNFVQRFLQAKTGAKTIRRDVLRSVGNPKVDAAGAAHCLTDFRRNLHTSLAVIYPELTNFFVGGGKGQAVLHHGVREPRGVEVYAFQARFLRPFYPRFEVLVFVSVTVYLALVFTKDRIACVYVYALLTRHQLERRRKIGKQFFGVSCSARVITRRLNPARKGIAAVKADNVVALPAVNADGKLGKTLHRRFSVYAKLGIDLFCFFISGHNFFSFMSYLFFAFLRSFAVAQDDREGCLIYSLPLRALTRTPRALL